MAKSMTGYGESVRTGKGWAIRWEIKSVNSRFLDIKFRLPHALNAMQAEFEATIRGVASRGRVEVFLDFQVHDPQLLDLTLHRGRAWAMVRELEKFALESGQAEWRPDLNRLFGLSSLWQENAQKPDKEIQQGLMVGLQEALAVWDDSRSREGQALQNDLEEKWKALIGLLQSIESLVEDNVETRFQVVQERMESLLVKFSVEVDETRMLQELALISDRMDVSEELTRLRAHFREFSRVLGIQGDMGRRLDFLLQECFREINTCGTKAQNHEISAKVVEFKTGLEKLREQIQNFE